MTYVSNFSHFISQREINEGLDRSERSELRKMGLGESGFKIEVSEYMDKEAEEQAALDFTWSPPVDEVVVDSLDMDVPDDFNGYIEIGMSNGDKIVYDMQETRTPNRSGAPPYYNFSLSINGKVVSTELDEVLTGSGALVGDVLDFYRNYLNHGRNK